MRRGEFTKVCRVVRPRYLPEKLADDTLYLVENDAGEVYLVSFRCPCGCGDELPIPLRTPDPWQLEQHADGTLTLRPSISYRIGCRSHFSISANRVEWH